MSFKILGGEGEGETQPPDKMRYLSKKRREFRVVEVRYGSNTGTVLWELLEATFELV